MPFPLPFPYTPGLPGSGLGDPAAYADAIQANFDALAIAFGQGTAKGGSVSVTVPNTSGGFGAFPATVVTHGLGATPSMAIAQWGTSPPTSFTGPRAAILACDTFTSTQLTIKGDTGTNISAGTYAVNWIAVA